MRVSISRFMIVECLRNDFKCQSLNRPPNALEVADVMSQSNPSLLTPGWRARCRRPDTAACPGRISTNFQRMNHTRNDT